MTNTNTKFPLPPGSFGLPLVGETLSFLRDNNFAEKREKKYGKIYKSHIFGNPTIFLAGAEANKFLFSNENKYFMATWPKSTRILLGPDSLTVQQGSVHQQRRRLLAQAFQPRALANYAPPIETMTANYLEKWVEMGTLTWYPEIRNYTFDIASLLFMGSDDSSQTKLISLFEEWVKGLFSIPLSLPWTRFGKSLRCRQKLLQHIEEIILQRQQQQNLGEDALGILLQAQDKEVNGLSLDELKDQILLLLFAGHETLTSAIASFCLLTSQHLDVLTRLRQEQKQFSAIEPLTLENLKRMTYLDMVLKEVLRLIPPAGGGFRQVTQDCEFCGYSIPKGWLVQYQIAKTHQDETLYPDDKNFDPERFAPENAVDKQKVFGYVPFGGGMRECLGKEFARLEMKIFAVMLLRGYEWELLPEQDLSVVAAPIPYPRDGLKVKFRKVE
ncbi:MAG: cytochrome P450 [Trichodesmium sp. St11_bin5]|nr:cytochrome P450 [Trichodesmium sp. St11_bin5]